MLSDAEIDEALAASKAWRMSRRYDPVDHVPALETSAPSTAALTMKRYRARRVEQAN